MVVAEHAAPRSAAAPASVGARLAAYLLDWLVTFIVVCLCTAAAGLILLATSDMGRNDPPNRAIYASLLVAALAAPIWVGMTLAGWAWRGRTVGKTAMSLRIVDRSGRPPGIARSLLRLVVYLAENVPLAAAGPVLAAAVAFRAQHLPADLLAAFAAILLLPLVSTAVMVRDRHRRALHDLVAGTVVVAE